MTDSGFSGLPPGPRPPAAADAKRVARDNVLRVIESTGALRAQARAERLAGEIVAENRDGTLRIATPEGTLTVQKPPQRPDMTVGARVEIDVPPGNPPRQIVLRAVTPRDAAPRETIPRDIISRDTTPRATTPPPATPLPATALPHSPAAPATPRPAPLLPEQLVRLLPLPPAQAAALIVPPPAPQFFTLPPASPVNAPPAPVTTAPTANILVPTPQSTALPPPAFAPAPVAATVTQAPSPAPVTMLAAAPPTANAALSVPPPATVLSAAPLLAAALALRPENFITTPAPATAPPLPLLQPVPAAPFVPPPAAVMGKTDARIVAINPPPLILQAPAAPGHHAPPPADTPAKTMEAPHAGTMPAHIRGITAQNFPVLSVTMPGLGVQQDFIMQFPASNLPPGATVHIVPHGTAGVGMVAAPFTPLAEFSVPGLWPALDEALQTLQQAAPALARQITNASLPQIASPARLPALAMMFVAALRGGDLQGWLGERATDTLRRAGKSDLLARLSRDGGALARLSAADPATPAQDWRSTALPLVWDNHVYRVMMHYRHDRAARGEDGERHNGTRFILDLAPPRMGAVQIDGLHRPPPAPAATGRLDIILRTQENPSPAMQQALRRLYHNALEQAGLHGELSFHARAEGWITINNNGAA